MKRSAHNDIEILDGNSLSIVFKHLEPKDRRALFYIASPPHPLSPACVCVKVIVTEPNHHDHQRMGSDCPFNLSLAMSTPL